MKKSKRIHLFKDLPPYAFLLFIIVLCTNISFDQSLRQKQLVSLIEDSRNESINFLAKNQLESGEFGSLICTDKTMFSCKENSSLFTSTFTLFALKDINTPLVNQMKENALLFLKLEENYGRWKYWTKLNPLMKSNFYDLDDTAVISFILKQNDLNFYSNKHFFVQNKNDLNLFYTWLGADKNHNDIDCVVNANVLLYLGEDETVCKYINQNIRAKSNCSYYYPDRLALLYTASRAYKNGVNCLGENKELIIKEIILDQKIDSSFGSPLQTALATNTLINFSYCNKETQNGLLHLINEQQNSGAWQREPLFFGHNFYFGSEELTTSIALEALNNYLINCAKTNSS
jgi:hypothetical protein